MDIQGLIIDPQEDFCNPETGTLYVPGAKEDMARLAAMLRRIAGRVGAIHVTLDSHHYLDIAHPIWWKDEECEHPAPFTIIAPDDVQAGRWTTTHPEALERSFAYVDALDRNGRYPLCIWPYHCLVGSSGHAIAPGLFGALKSWEAGGFGGVNYIWKGRNIWTEHYSAIRADVPDPNDPATQPNRALLDRLNAADLIFVAGEAGSHCVANTVRDIADELGDTFLEKLTLITDAVSPVGGFESLQRDFIGEMTDRGMKTATTLDFLL